MADNHEALGTEFVTHLGDLVDQPEDLASWDIADCAMAVLDQANLEYSVLPAASRKNGGPPVKQGLLAPQETKLPRSIDPNHFLVTEDVKNQTIFLVDDTWTTGSHVLSARKALMAAGGSTVDIFVVARWLRATGSHVLSARKALMAAGGSTVDIFVVARWLRATGNFSGTALYEQAGENYSSLRGVRLFKEI